MDYIILFIVVGTYCIVAGIWGKINKLEKLIPSNSNDKKKFPSLKELIGKVIEIETDDEQSFIYGEECKGILKEFNETWLVLEVINKKNKKEHCYHRLNNLKSIDVVNEK